MSTPPSRIVGFVCLTRVFAFSSMSYCHSDELIPAYLITYILYQFITITIIPNNQIILILFIPYFQKCRYSFNRETDC